MPTFTQEAIATKKQQEVKLVGVDMYIISEKGVPTFKDETFAPFKCEFISNRGTKVWPGYVSPDLLMVNWYRCRFMATKDIKDADINAFLETLTREGWWWSAAQKLWNYDGQPGFSKAY